MDTRAIAPVLAAPHDMFMRRIYALAIRDEQPDCSALVEHQLNIREAVRRGEEADEADTSAASALIRKAGNRCCGSITSYVDQYHYWGGLVEEVQVDAARLSEAAAILRGFAPLRMLTLTRLRGHVAQVLKEPILGQLVALDIGENGLTDDDIIAVANSPLLKELRVLRIAGNVECGYQSLRALAALPNLRFVDADDTKTPLRIYTYDGCSGSSDVDYTHAQGVMEAELGELPWITGALNRISYHEL